MPVIKEFRGSKGLKEFDQDSNKALCLVDPDGRFLEVNRPFTELLGYRFSDLKKISFAEIKHDFSKEDEYVKKHILYFNLYSLYLSEKNPILVTFRHKKGMPVLVRLNAVIKRDQTGRIMQAVGIIEKAVEIADKAEVNKEKFKDRVYWGIEQTYRQVLENSGDAILVTDYNHRVITVNRAALQLMGCHAEDELLGKFIIELGPSEGSFKTTAGETFSFNEAWKRKQMEIATALLEKDRADGLMYLYSGPDLVVPVDVTLSVLRDKNGERIGTVCICRDITERRIYDLKQNSIHDELESRVRERTVNMEEANTALNVLLKKREEDKQTLEEKILYNVDEMVMPYIKKIKNGNVNENQKTYLNIIERNLKEIVSSFSHRLSVDYMKLTPSEIQIANFIRQGRRTKEIAEALNLSLKTIESHRKNIRKKIGINNKKVNLRSYLLSLK